MFPGCICVRVRLCVSFSLARSSSLSLPLSLPHSLSLFLSLFLCLSLAHSRFCSDSRSTFVSFYFSDRVYLFTFISMCFVCVRLRSCLCIRACVRACVCGCVYVYQKLKLKTVLNLSEHKYPTDSVEFLKEEAVIPHGVVCCSVQYHML